MQSNKIDTLGKYLKNVRLNDLKKLHSGFTEEQEAEHLAGFAKKFMSDKETYVLLESDKLIMDSPFKFLLRLMSSFRENPSFQYCGDAAFELFFVSCLSKAQSKCAIADEPTIEAVKVVANKAEVQEEMKKDPVSIAVKKKSKKK